MKTDKNTAKAYIEISHVFKSFKDMTRAKSGLAEKSWEKRRTCWKKPGWSRGCAGLLADSPSE